MQRTRNTADQERAEETEQEEEHDDTSSKRSNRRRREMSNENEYVDEKRMPGTSSVDDTDDENEQVEEHEDALRDSSVPIASILKFWFGVIHATCGFFLVFIGTVAPYWAQTIADHSYDTIKYFGVFAECTERSCRDNFPNKERRYTAGAFEIFAILSAISGFACLIVQQLPLAEKIKIGIVGIPKWSFLIAFVLSMAGFLIYAAFQTVTLGWAFWVVCLGSLCLGFGAVCQWFP